MSAPTTAEVREALERWSRTFSQTHWSLEEDRAEASAMARSLADFALPLAEHRDAERARAEAAEEAVDDLSDEVRSLRTRSLELSIVEERCDWESEVAPKWDEDGNEHDASDRVARLVDALRAERARADALAAEVAQLRADLARVSNEMGLPPGIGPADGELRRLLAEGRKAMVERDAERHAAADKSAALMAAEAEVGRLRSVMHAIATLDDDDPDVVLLDDWDVADVYGSLRAAITSARMALAAKGEGR